MKRDSKLLAPFKMGDLTLKNRVVMASMTRARAGKEMRANELMAQYYHQRASAGLILAEGTFVSKEGIGWPQAPGIWSKEQVEGWKPAVNAVHQESTPFFLQLWHTGRASHKDFHDGEAPVAPSAIQMKGKKIHVLDGEKKTPTTPRALTTEEIPRLIEDYVKAAHNAKEAGFDGIELHCANGYLLDCFLQSKTNKREDRYGGSLKNRFRLIGELLEACGSVYSSQRIGVKLSPNGEFNDMGSEDFRETFRYVLEQLNNFDLAYVQVMDGLAFGFHELGEPMTIEEMRKVYQGNLMANCGYTVESAESAIDAGNADLVSFARPFIANPDFVERIENGWNFNPPSPAEEWYAHEPSGYVDFPTYEEARKDKLVGAPRS